MEFSFEGINRHGRVVSGRRESAHEGQLRMELRTQGIRPVKISRPLPVSQDMSSFSRQTQAQDLEKFFIQSK